LVNDPMTQFSLVIPENDEERMYCENYSQSDIHTVFEVKPTINTISDPIWKGFIYTCRLENLIPDSCYRYRVGNMETNEFSQYITFKVPALGPCPTTIVTFADFDTVNEIKKR